VPCAEQRVEFGGIVAARMIRRTPAEPVDWQDLIYDGAVPHVTDRICPWCDGAGQGLLWAPPAKPDDGGDGAPTVA
jgi:hypothetical protein